MLAAAGLACGVAANAQSAPTTRPLGVDRGGVGATAARGECQRVESRTNLGPLSGRSIATIDIATGDPRATRLPLLTRLTSRTHVRTQQNTLRRMMLIAARDTVDTLRVAESLRRLRRLSYLDDVLIVTTDCGARTPLALTVLARDAMSFRPDIRFNSASPPNAVTGTASASPRSYVVGMDERNLLGTGRDLRVATIGAGGRSGFNVGVADPTALGSLYAAGARMARNPLENATAFSVRPPDRELGERWRGEFGVASIRRSGLATHGASFARAGGQALVGRRVADDDGRGAAAFVMIGAETERTRLLAAPGAIVGGPTAVHRDFSGLDLGVGRYAEQYGAITWLLPDARVVDVPRGFEGEFIAGLGRDLNVPPAAHDPNAPRGASDASVARATAHLDLWTGRMWVPTARMLVVADVWGTGYVSRGTPISDGSARAALASVSRARGGFVYGRIAIERLAAPDPDEQALLGFDPTVRILATRTRLAPTAVAGLLERDWRVKSRVGHVNLDLAGFGAASYRTSERTPQRTPGIGVNQLSTAVGAGVHLVPNAIGRSALRFDYVIPVSHGRGGRSTPYVAASVTPWIVFNRFRDGRRYR